MKIAMGLTFVASLARTSMACKEATTLTDSDMEGKAGAPPGEVTSASDEGANPKTHGRGHGQRRPLKHLKRGRPLGHELCMHGHGRGHMRSTRAKSKNQPQWLTEVRQDGELTSESEETTRINRATKRTKRWAQQDEGTSGSDVDHAMGEVGIVSSSMPKTSGVFDYAEWLLSKLSEEQRKKLARSFSYMDLCAGLGTTLIVYEAIRRALNKHALCIHGECHGMTELSKDRREALGRRLASLSFAAPILPRNADLTANTSDGVLADILFMGIVCVDISQCSSTPKSLTDPKGSSGASWMEFLACLDKLKLEDRPKVIILECVANLGNNRQIQGRTEKGTTLVVEALKERGYIGEWKRISATHFGLPQRRPRVWGFFLKMIGGIGPKAIQTATQNVAVAMNVVRNGLCAGHEPLEAILARTPMTEAYRHAKPSSRTVSWKHGRHPAFQAQQGLTDAEVAPGQAEFYEATHLLMLPREQEAIWFELCKQRKSGRIPNWERTILVSDCGSSLGWLSIAQGMFPCVRPGNKYLILRHGVPSIARGPECLAVQGIGIHEANATNLFAEDDKLLRTLAGNAFTANICCAFFVAALLALCP